MALRQLDAEEAGQVSELVRLGTGIALAGDDQRVEVRAGLEPEAVALGLFDEAEVEADVVADDQRVADEVQQLVGCLLRARCALDVLVGDAVHLVADDRSPGIHERRPAVDDLGALDLDRGDLDEVRHLGVGAGRLGVDDDELALGIGRRREIEDRVGRRLDVRDALGLADRLLDLLLEVDDRLERAVAEQDGLGHDGLGQQVGAGLDHHDRVARAGDDQVELGVLELAERRVDDELAVDPADAHRATGPLNGISLIVRAADAAIVPTTSGRFSWSVERTVITSWTSSL